MAYLPYGCNLFEAPFDPGNFHFPHSVRFIALLKSFPFSQTAMFFIFLFRLQARYGDPSEDRIFWSMVHSKTELNRSRPEDIQVRFERIYSASGRSFVWASRGFGEDNRPSNCSWMQSRLKGGRTRMCGTTFRAEVFVAARIRYVNRQINVIERRNIAFRSTQALASGRRTTHRSHAFRKAIIFDESAVKPGQLNASSFTFYTQR